MEALMQTQIESVMRTQILVPTGTPITDLIQTQVEGMMEAEILVAMISYKLNPGCDRISNES